MKTIKGDVVNSRNANKLLQAAINEVKLGEHCGIRWTVGFSLFREQKREQFARGLII